MQIAAVEQRLEHRVGAADMENVGGQIAPAWLQVGDQRRARKHLGDVIEHEAQSGLMRDRGQVQAGIGRAAGCRHHRGRIFQGFAGDEVARQRAAARQNFGDALARAFRQRAALGIDRGQHRRPGRREPQRLRHHGHGVGGELAGAGADGRRTGAL